MDEPPLAQKASFPQRLTKALEKPAVFFLASTTIGMGTGLSLGGYTAILRNLIETPAAVPHIIRTTKIVGRGVA